MAELDRPGGVRPGIPDLPWASWSHRQVLAELITSGWLPGGAGDWAVGLRSPDGTLVARVCPFDPAYQAFVALCRRCAGNRWLPRIELAADLAGGGSVVFLEFAAGVDRELADEVAGQWRSGQWRTGTGDAELAEVRRIAEVIARESSAAEIHALREAWGSAGDVG